MTPITQKSLAKLHSHHPHKIRLDHLDKEERRILRALKSGSDIQPGAHKVSVQLLPVPKRIPWRRVAAELAEQLNKPTYISDLEKEAAKATKKFNYLVFE
jgi:hypothetical protein